MQNFAHVLNTADLSDFREYGEPEESTELVDQYKYTFRLMNQLFHENEIPDYEPAIFNYGDKKVYEMHYYGEVTEETEIKMRYRLENTPDEDPEWITTKVIK
jgi:hypothetical protein